MLLVNRAEMHSRAAVREISSGFGPIGPPRLEFQFSGWTGRKLGNRAKSVKTIRKVSTRSKFYFRSAATRLSLEGPMKLVRKIVANDFRNA